MFSARSLWYGVESMCLPERRAGAPTDYESGFGTPDLIDVEEQLAGALGLRVEVVSAGGLKPGKHDAIRRDAVTVF